MAYVLHTAQAIDRATLHRDRCPEVPENIQYHDLWTGTWQEIVDKERAYEALELSNSKYKKKCPLCKP
ncbi:MAG TPA: hypothetical protein VGJ57_12085 [Nitrospirales bacterium]